MIEASARLSSLTVHKLVSARCLAYHQILHRYFSDKNLCVFKSFFKSELCCSMQVKYKIVYFSYTLDFHTIHWIISRWILILYNIFVIAFISYIVCNINQMTNCLKKLFLHHVFYNCYIVCVFAMLGNRGMYHVYTRSCSFPSSPV